MSDADTPSRRYGISCDTSWTDLVRIHHWLSTDACWAPCRTREQPDRAVAGSLDFGAYDVDSGEQAGYARVVTDHTSFAWLRDVYVDPAARGPGLGTGIVTAVRENLTPAGVRRFVLVPDDAHAVYEKAGFAPLASPEKWMSLQLR